MQVLTCFENDGEIGAGEVDYAHYGASIGKDGFSFAVDKNDLDQFETLSNVRFTVGYVVDFEL